MLSVEDQYGDETDQARQLTNPISNLLWHLRDPSYNHAPNPHQQRRNRPEEIYSMKQDPKFMTGLVAIIQRFPIRPALARVHSNDIFEDGVSHGSDRYALS